MKIRYDGYCSKFFWELNGALTAACCHAKMEQVDQKAEKPTQVEG